jgi:hypothetical protein
VCADIAFGLRARIEGWSTRPKEKAGEERRRKEKKIEKIPCITSS